MLDRYETVVKVEEVIKYADTKQYKKACEVLDTINTSKMKNYEDLIIFAEVYLKNKRYIEAKEILTRVHERTTTRRLMALLISVNAKMHNYVEAEECYKEYIRIAPRDVNRFILRYKIDKAKGLDCDALIKPLEQLKEYDLIEEWEYELAKLYHKAGYEDKCISECNTIIMMFGAGVIVEKAKLLRDYHIEALNKKADEKKDLSEFNATMQLSNIIGKVKEKLADDDESTVKSSDEEDYGEGTSISPKIEDEYAMDNDKITDEFFEEDKTDVTNETSVAEETPAGQETPVEQEEPVMGVHAEEFGEGAIQLSLLDGFLTMPDDDEDEDDELDIKFDSAIQRDNNTEEDNEETKEEINEENQIPEEEIKEEIVEESKEDESEADLELETESETEAEAEVKVEVNQDSIDEQADETKEEPDDDFIKSISNMVSSQVEMFINEEKKKNEPVEIADDEYDKIMQKLTILLTPSMYDEFNTKDINDINRNHRKV